MTRDETSFAGNTPFMSYMWGVVTHDEGRGVYFPSREAGASLLVFPKSFAGRGVRLMIDGNRAIGKGKRGSDRGSSSTAVLPFLGTSGSCPALSLSTWLLLNPASATAYLFVLFYLYLTVG